MTTPLLGPLEKRLAEMEERHAEELQRMHIAHLEEWTAKMDYRDASYNMAIFATVGWIAAITLAVALVL